MITVINNAEDILGDGFFGAGKCSLLGGGYICILDGCLVHEVFVDGNGTIFKVIGLGKDPCVPQVWLLDTVVHSEGVLGMF